jgi:exopolysaccharide biosynthesis polyprenyl glycosylphosphotransferase
MFARHKRILGGLYLAGDALVALASFGLAYAVRSNLIVPRPLYPVSNYSWIIPVTAGLWVSVGLALGIYREIRDEEWRRALVDPIKVAFFATTLLFAFVFAFKLMYISRLLLGLYAASDLVLMVLFRLVARRLSVGEPQHFLLVGATAEAMDIARTLEASEHRGPRLVGFARVEPGSGEGISAIASGLHRSYPVYNLSQLPELLRRHVIDEVIFAVGKDDLAKLEETFLMCEEEGVTTRLVLSFFPHVISKVSLERLRDTPLLTFSTIPEDESSLLLKRILDLVMAFTLLIVFSPLFLILTLLIMLTSKGPVLFRQVRCGLGGRKFTLLKFRSMHPDADLRREELEALNEMDGPLFKIQNDPRCTPVGRFMRKFSLDELPQLVNILKGEMSFVGPRPPLPEEVEKYEPWQRRRLRMQPGLTCLWALEGRSRLNFRRWMELDLQYIDNWSPALDWKILLRTIPVVLLGRGAS